MAELPDRPVLARLIGVSKSFGPVRAAHGVSIDLRAGEVHGLVGENGAGKSTLAKILGGVYRPDEGTVEMGGHPIVLRGPSDARRHGITVVHQELTVFPDLTVAENVFMGHLPSRRFARIDRERMNRDVAAALADLGVDLDVRQPMRELSIGRQQLVEIAKGVTADARVVVMDEPTASLTPSEVGVLFRTIRRLTAHGVAVVFVSHRLDEVFSVCDRITIMRDGELVLTADRADLTPDQVIRHMVGRRLEGYYPRPTAALGDVLLRVRGLTRFGVFEDVSFDLRHGEILGLAGLVGAGRTEIARALFGIDRFDSGSIELDGKSVEPRSAGEAMAAGIAYLPEDRHEQGILLETSITRNVTLAALKQVAMVFGLVRPGAEVALAEGYTRRLDVRMHSIQQMASSLSGGNQQKVVLAKWLATKPRVLIVDEPTRGIDVGAKAEVHTILSELAASGVAILMISSELPELLGMTHRVLVVHQGRISGEFAFGAADQERVMAAATGQARAS
jgi:rhamnose transport system ATP-binding protein